MVCHSYHARIENTQKSYPTSHPYDWSHLVQWAEKENFKVEDINQSNSYDFQSLLKIKSASFYYCILFYFA